MPKTLSIETKVQALRQFYRAEARVPSYAEMLALLGYRSKNAVYRLVNRLEKAGYVQRRGGGRIAFTRRLTARVEHLLSRYGSGPSPFEPEALADLAASCPIVEQNIQPVSDHRVSDRQGRTIPITGFVGHATLADVPRPVRQLWRLAETLHAGKGAPMGLGHVRVTEVA